MSSANDQPMRDARKLHQTLLKRLDSTPDFAALLPEVTRLMEQVRRIGEGTADPEERDYLRTLLAFWGNWVFGQTRVYPDTELYPPTPEARQTYEDDRNRLRITQQNLNGTTGDSTADSSVIRGLLGLVAVIAVLVVVVLGVLLTRSNTAATDTPGATLIFQGAALAASTGGEGQPVIVADVIAPADGAQFQAGEEIALSGIYSNFQPEWRVFFVVKNDAGQVVPVGRGFAVAMPNATGAWQPPTPLVLNEPGTYQIGLVLAVTPDAISAVLAFSEESSSMDTLPPGALPFFDLSTITIS